MNRSKRKRILAIETLSARRLLTTCAPPSAQLPQTVTVSEVESVITKVVASRQQFGTEEIAFDQFESESALVDRLVDLAQQQYGSILGQAADGSLYAAHVGTLIDCGWQADEDPIQRDIITLNDAGEVEDLGRIDSVGAHGGGRSESFVVDDRLILVNPISPIGVSHDPDERGTQARVRVDIFDLSHPDLKLTDTYTIDGHLIDAQVSGKQFVLTQFDAIPFPHPELLSDIESDESFEIEASTIAGTFETAEQYGLRIRDSLVGFALPDYSVQDADGNVIVQADLGDWQDVSVIAGEARRTSITMLDLSSESVAVADVELMYGGLLRIQDATDDHLLMSRRTPVYSSDEESHVDLALVSINEAVGDLAIEAVGSLTGSVDVAGVQLDGQRIHAFVDRRSDDYTQESRVQQIDYHLIEPSGGRLTSVGSILDVLPNRETFSRVPVASHIDSNQIVAALHWNSPRLLKIDLSDPTQPLLSHSSEFDPERREFTNLVHLQGSLFAALSNDFRWSVDVYQLNEDGSFDVVAQHETVAISSSIPRTASNRSEELIWFTDRQILVANIGDRSKDILHIFEVDVANEATLTEISTFDLSGRVETFSVRDDVLIMNSSQTVAVVDLDSPTRITVIDHEPEKKILIPPRVDQVLPESAVPQDVNGDGIVTALDALLVINVLNAVTSDQPRDMDFLIRSFTSFEHIANVDVDGNGFLTALDALRVVNLLNRSSNTGNVAAAEAERPESDRPDEDESGVDVSIDFAVTTQLF